MDHWQLEREHCARFKQDQRSCDEMSKADLQAYALSCGIKPYQNKAKLYNQLSRLRTMIETRGQNDLLAHALRKFHNTCIAVQQNLPGTNDPERAWKDLTSIELKEIAKHLLIQHVSSCEIDRMSKHDLVRVLYAYMCQENAPVGAPLGGGEAALPPIQGPWLGAPHAEVEARIAQLKAQQAPVPLTGTFVPQEGVVYVQEAQPAPQTQAPVQVVMASSSLEGTLRAQIEQLNADKLNLERQWRECELSLNQLRLERDESRQIIAELKNSLHTTVEQFQASQADLKQEVDVTLEFKHNEKSELERKIRDLDNENQRLKLREIETKGRYDTEHAEHDLLKRRAQTLETDLERERRESKNAKEDLQISQANEQNSARALAACQTQIKEFERQLAVEKTALGVLRQSSNVLLREKTSCQEALESKQHQLKRLENENATLQRQLNESKGLQFPPVQVGPSLETMFRRTQEMKQEIENKNQMIRNFDAELKRKDQLNFELKKTCEEQLQAQLGELNQLRTNMAKATDGYIKIGQYQAEVQNTIFQLQTTEDEKRFNDAFRYLIQIVPSATLDLQRSVPVPAQDLTQETSMRLLNAKNQAILNAEDEIVGLRQSLAQGANADIAEAQRNLQTREALDRVIAQQAGQIRTQDNTISQLTATMEQQDQRIRSMTQLLNERQQCLEDLNNAQAQIVLLQNALAAQAQETKYTPVAPMQAAGEIRVSPSQFTPIPIAAPQAPTQLGAGDSREIAKITAVVRSRSRSQPTPVETPPIVQRLGRFTQRFTAVPRTGEDIKRPVPGRRPPFIPTMGRPSPSPSPRPTPEVEVEFKGQAALQPWRLPADAIADPGIHNDCRHELFGDFTTLTVNGVLVRTGDPVIDNARIDEIRTKWINRLKECRDGIDSHLSEKRKDRITKYINDIKRSEGQNDAIRAGAINIYGLRLLDNWGRPRKKRAHEYACDNFSKFVKYNLCGPLLKEALIPRQEPRILDLPTLRPTIRKTFQ